VTTMTLEAAVLNITGPGDVSGYMQKCELTCDVEEKDVTTFKSEGWKEVTGGLKKAGLKVDLLNDITDDALDEDMWTVYSGGVPVVFYVKLDDATTGAANPAYYGKTLITSWTPISGKPGDTAGSSYSWPCSGKITRYTT
jgi:hypothetical protein